MIADAGPVNSIGQLQAAGNALSFSFSQSDPKVIPLVTVSFPIVYRELKKGQDEPSFWSLFFPDWDRCKTVRKEVARRFIQSSWPPSRFLEAALPTGDLERILQTVAKEDGGGKYLNSLRDFISDFDSPEKESLLEAVESLLPADHELTKADTRPSKRKHKH
jgi:hypothetical protein